MNPFPEQLASVEIAKAAPGHRWLFGDEMGVGKTLQAILTARDIGCDHIVVVGPAMARGTWYREFPKWWPEQYEDESRMCMIDISPTRKSQSKKRAATWEEALTRPVRIVSAELLNADRERAHLDAAKRPCLILDEGHMYAIGSTKRSRALRRLTRRYKGALLATTATPIPNRPIGMFNLFDLVWPRRFGRPGPKGKASYEFAFRYVERIQGEYGSIPGGLSALWGDELRDRLRWMVSRITRQEIAHRLPPCQIQPLAVDPSENLNDVVQEWIDDGTLGGGFCVVLTHKRARAKSLAELLQRRHPTVPLCHVDGDTPTTQRMGKIERFRDNPAGRGILVATMHSLARSISLSWCHQGLLAELYWSPEVLTQVVGRFARLDGHLKTIVNVLVGANTVQERIAFSVADKLFDNASLLKQGAAEAGLSAALQMSDEEMEKQLLDAAFSVCSESEFAMLSALEGGE